MKTYRMRHSGMGYQSKWLVVETDKPLRKFIYNYMVERYYVYDADNCGDETVEFVFTDVDGGKEQFWKCCHSWWIQTIPHWDMQNEWDIARTDKVNFTYPAIDRNWMTLEKN